MSFQNNPPQSVLIINIFGIGDVLFTTPLISNLKAQFPGIKIGYLCNNRTAGMLEQDPGIERVFIYDRDDFHAAFQSSKLGGMRKMSAFIRDIKREGFDTSIDVSLSDLTGWITWRAGIKRRVGFKYKKRGIFLNQAVGLKGYDEKPVAEYYLDLLEHIGVKRDIKEFRLTVDPSESDWAEEYFRQNIDKNGSDNAIGIVPGGGASWGKDANYKRWDAEKYAKLADYLIENFSVPIILFGDKSEMDLCRKVAAFMANPSITACGKTTIGQFAALARKCALMIVNDGGPLHIAVAAGVRTASIFGPVNEVVYGPYPKADHIVIKKNIACQPCYRRFRRASCDHISCLTQLTVEEVFQELKGAL